MRIVVTGGAGFIGSNIVERLCADGHDTVVVDDFSTGQRAFLEEFAYDGDVVEMDLLDTAALTEVVDGADAVIHLAANADVRYGWDHPRRDLEQNVHVTLGLAEAMHATGVRRLLFSSTGSVYGEAEQIPTPEGAAFPVQTSLYGASKAAAEGFLAAYAEAGRLDVTVFRFVSILGARYTHGHVVDFVSKLRRDPSSLEILGDGSQRKSYLHIDDCVRAVLGRLDEPERFETYNLGVDDYCTTAQSAGWICERLGLEPELRFTGGDRGWVGDNPFILLDTTRIRATGWTPSMSIRASVESTVDYLSANEWVLDLVDSRSSEPA